MKLLNRPKRSKFNKPSSTKGIFYGWYLVGSSALINGLGGSIQWQGFTVFFIPVSQSLGLSSAQTSMVFALSRAENGVIGPITGWLIDKFGVRPLMFCGTALAGIGYIWLSRTNTFLAFLLVYLFVVSLGASTSFMQATAAALNTWFIKRRGVAMGINSAAYRLGAAFMVPLLSFVVLGWGWEMASLCIGIGMLVFIVPLTLLFRRSPETMGLLPDGESPSDLNSTISQIKPLSEEDTEFSPREAISTRSFWVLALATVLRISVHGALFVHFVPLLVWKGEAPQTAANLIGLLSLTAVPFILLLGWLSDRIKRQYLLALSYSSSGLSLLLLIMVEGTWPIFAAMLLFIGSEAGSSLNWALVGDLFGRKWFATIRGFLAPIYNTALFITPITVGWMFDRTGSYQTSLFFGAGLMFLAAFTFYRLKSPK